MQRTVGASNATHSRTGLERLGDKNTLAVRKKNKAFIRYSHVPVKWDNVAEIVTYSNGLCAFEEIGFLLCMNSHLITNYLSDTRGT